MAARTMNEKQRELVISHLSVAEWFIYHNYQANPAIPGFAREDLEQVGYLALCKAALFFDGRTKFETYAQSVLRTTLADYCRDVLPEEQCISLDEPITADGEGRCRYELLPDPRSDSFEREMENWDVLERCEKAYTGICKMGVEAIRLHLSGYTGVEIAQMYGREPNQVQAWMSKARKKMKTDPAVIAALQ